MKKVILKQLTLLNFKGIKTLSIDFDEKETCIFGTNGSGKTTILDAFLWLLFGKDSTDRKDFEIKTLTSDGLAIEKIDHEVTGVLQVDGRIVTLKRCYREKWQKKRGSEEAEFTGHETIFFVDDVPFQAYQYNEKINSIVDESVFKMLTNPGYFNSLKWEQRRQVLINIAGEISDDEIQAMKPEFKDILKVFEGKSYKEFKTMIAAKKKVLKDDIDKIPARIDEAQRMIPQEPDYAALNTELTSLSAQLTNIDNQIGDILKQQQGIQEKERARQEKIFSLKSKLKQIEFEVEQAASAGSREKQSHLRQLNGELSEIGRLLTRNTETIKSNDQKIAHIESKLEQLRRDWNTEDQKQIVFDEHKFTCPTCKRAYEPSDIEAQKEQMISNFNKNKLEKCNQIKNEGIELNKSLSSLKEENISLHNQIVELSDKEASLKKQISDVAAIAETPVSIDYSSNPEYDAIKASIATLESEVYTAPDNSELKAQKVTLQNQINEIRTKLAVKDQADRSRARVKELNDELKDKAQQLANLEKQEFIADDFTNTKMNLVESRVNRMFKHVRFKLFEQLINGGTEPACVALVDGIPWPDANNAGRINAGLDIINTLSEYYQVSAPVFLDNAESCIEFIPTQSQLVKLIVSASHKKLTVSAKNVSKSVENVPEMA
jgi:exonuclease SbcC